MAKVFIETSVFIRFFTQDDKQKSEDTLRLFKLIENGKLRPYTSNIVILEIQFVLIKVYKFNKNKVLKAIENLLNLRNLTLIEKTNTKIALGIYKKLNIKYADCLIATQVQKDVKIVTYDEEFSKIIGISTTQPTDFLNHDKQNQKTQE